MLRGFLGNLIFAIIARMLCGNHLNLFSRYDPAPVSLDRMQATLVRLCQQFISTNEHT